jgi:hypothetical protein
VNWDILHTRFASSIRDSVSSATLSGLELTVSDRDAYLNYAYNKYIRLLILANKNNGASNILHELYKITSLTLSSGVASIPTDYSYYIDVVGASGEEVNIVLDDWLRYKYLSPIERPYNDTNLYILITSDIKCLPSTFSGSIEMSYIAKAIPLVQGGQDDIVLTSEHWDTIIEFAKASYQRDKLEFELAKSLEDDAVSSSMFLSNLKNKG